MSKKAIILGATGLSGGHLLEQLLHDARYGEVVVFGRNSTSREHPKLREFHADLLKLEEQEARFFADEVYCCIGTTKAKTPDKDTYRKIDLGIPLQAAKLCSKNGINTLTVISAMGAKAGSPVFYNRIKGEMEEKVLEVGVPRTYMVQPSLIGGERDENRPAEWFFKQLFKGLNYLMVGPLKKYRSIQPEEIAKAMIWLSNEELPPGRYENDRLIEFAEQYKA
ncbi:NAD(P)H-binding protein [Robertkochia flava]|uniref:NAD(P)H-binding protein n=1 Tax=Robertkochia flava TaxID=3447986 RepID=UPI001CCAF9DF|nr:NAD(P)H-binding protein [Robertkochia marina]